MENSNIKVLSFSSDSYNLTELQSMSKEELYALADMCKSIGDDTADICTLAEYQEYFNTGCVDPDHSYIFFISL